MLATNIWRAKKSVDPWRLGYKATTVPDKIGSDTCDSITSPVSRELLSKIVA
jgi:hypothetical protein